MEHAALLAHGLGVGDGRGEEAVPLHSAVQSRPLVVSAADIMDNGGITKCNYNFFLENNDVLERSKELNC